MQALLEWISLHPQSLPIIMSAIPFAFMLVFLVPLAGFMYLSWHTQNKQIPFLLMREKEARQDMMEAFEKEASRNQAIVSEVHTAISELRDALREELHGIRETVIDLWRTPGIRKDRAS